MSWKKKARRRWRGRVDSAPEDEDQRRQTQSGKLRSWNDTCVSAPSIPANAKGANLCAFLPAMWIGSDELAAGERAGILPNPFATSSISRNFSA